jgi:hypothetical protein
VWGSNQPKHLAIIAVSSGKCEWGGGYRTRGESVYAKKVIKKRKKGRDI